MLISCEESWPFFFKILNLNFSTSTPLISWTWGMELLEQS
jgi:hypothetical protein